MQMRGQDPSISMTAEEMNEPAVQSIQAWKSRRNSLDLRPAYAYDDVISVRRGQEPSLETSVAPSTLHAVDSLNDLLEAAAGPVPEELVAETLRRIALSKQEDSEGECSGDRLWQGCQVLACPGPAQEYQRASVGEDSRRRIKGAGAIERGKSRQNGGVECALTVVDAGQLRQQNPQRPGMAGSATSDALPRGYSPPPNLVDPSVLNYFQLAESVWEEDGRKCSLGTSVSGVSEVPSCSQFDTPTSLHPNHPGCSSLHSQLSCADSFVESSAPSTPTMFELKSPGSALGVGSSQGSSMQSSSTPATASANLRLQQHQHEQQLRRAEPLPGSAQLLNDTGSRVLAQVAVADPLILGYFQHIETMLKQKSHEGRAGMRLVTSSCHGSLTPTLEHFESEEQGWGQAEGWQSQGRFSSLPRRSPRMQQIRVTPQHRATASLAPDLLGNNSVFGVNSSQGGSNHSAQSADCARKPKCGSQLGSPRIVLDEMEGSPWSKPDVSKFLRTSQSRLPRRATGKGKTGTSMLKSLFVKHVWKAGE